MDLLNLTIAQAHDGLKKRTFSSVELTRAYLEQIKKTDKDINAFLSVAEDSAVAGAEFADEKIASGNFSELTGIPCAIKDAILVEGQKCTAASKILENYTAPYDATVIKKLKERGSVILGKTNTDEFTMGASTENSAFDVVKNPHDKTRVAGGSSGGSAAAVVALEACFALGSDTGGSIRLPASFCGVAGLNPTYGSVSRYGLIAHASSLDQIGPMAKNVEDIKIVFKTISGKDQKDATSSGYNFEDSEAGLKGLKIGMPEEYFTEGLDKEVEKIIKNAIKKAEQSGAEIKEISLPNTKYSIACYYIIVPSEASSNLARFDGIKYGLSDQSPKNLLDVYLRSRGQGFGQEPKRRIMVGTHSLSSGYYDAYYKKAQEVRQLIRQDFIKAFEKVDLIFCPVAPFPAFKIGEKVEDPLSMYLVDVYTAGVKLAGLPALSLPAGKTNGLPVGLQIIGNHFEENKILAVAEEMENVL
ncbi:MAG: aspartyl/glutamyl-tRNA amidotransferase subunit A [Candidatus Staskawiczbacteria bacterium RIFCSPLOWO2_01_FULL_37_25b]|uniref:Glutamyl-tRNA(Gln) amidotransferase subunit A n=2 Tax=Candidatus Staskawicziibacteriota TaxID=1817916 RepID=A0A1G2HN78_9BACT|nr:MAG: aspartyl/glutamyl-tRNA amidotransferase subunit A [Candidatus Staskawiczbacteria bacterium RIFCSPHIGHO2_01_FULL_36_16]OGZ72302.1 MAG: aspartyl/glutamyl-tRNA amidotransferase subunit A [Candidatus Staskawiczbacteria bacterium RIFCSPLOWO2_01_FULL_37_25b]